MSVPTMLFANSQRVCLRRVDGGDRRAPRVRKEERRADDDHRGQQQREKEALVHRLKADERETRSGHRIVSAGSEWVTPPDAAERKPSSAPRPVALERLDGVRGTARIITARGGKQVAKAHLISPHDEDEERSHHVALGVDGGGAASGDGEPAVHRASWAMARSTSAARCAKPMSYASGFTRTTTSYGRPLGRIRRRTSSRNRRLSRLRATAECR